MKANIDGLARDDHAAYDMGDGTFVTFGGYTNGTRVNELLKFKHDGSNVSGDIMHAGADGPSNRAGCSVVRYEDELYTFAGQEEDNKKLNDVWKFDMTGQSWS